MNNTYKYYNRRKDKRHLEDCVIRAISTATGLGYNATFYLIDFVAKSYDCPTLCVCCYKHLLTDILHYKCFRCRDGETVQEIAKKHPDKRVIIRVEGHVVCAIYGDVLDIWDSTNETADMYWLVE